MDAVAAIDLPTGADRSGAPFAANVSAAATTSTAIGTTPVPTALAVVPDERIATPIRQFLDSATNWVSGLPANPIADLIEGALLLLRRTLAPAFPMGPPGADLIGTSSPEAAPSAGGINPPTITLHNNTAQTLWVYNLTNSGDYSIPSDFTVVQVGVGSSTPVTLAAGTGPAGAPKNRIYIVEGPAGFVLPVIASSGVDAFNPTAQTADNSFSNYNFLEYFLYSADGGDEYTIDTSYIDEWSLPIQMRYTVNGAAWDGAVSGKLYGFKYFDTVVNQLNAAAKTGTPYGDLVWSGGTPWDPQPPDSVNRIIGPDKVWTQQSFEPPANVNMDETGWVPSSYQNFVQYGSRPSKDKSTTIYPFAQDGALYSAIGNFAFWKKSVNGPASTPYPTALRTAAILDGYPADDQGVYGFFTYPNDEAAGQFTNIPTSVSLDIYVHGSADGTSDSVIEGGEWFYSAPSRQGRKISEARSPLMGTEATDTFILNYMFKRAHSAPSVKASGEQGDIVVIDKGRLPGATSNVVDIVDKAEFSGCASDASQFVYESSTGLLYYDRDPSRPGYTGILANLAQGSLDPAKSVFVL